MPVVNAPYSITKARGTMILLFTLTKVDHVTM
jgi:hypothetical protein